MLKMNFHWQITFCVLKSTSNDICILFYLHNVLYFCKSEGFWSPRWIGDFRWNPYPCRNPPPPCTPLLQNVLNVTYGLNHVISITSTVAFVSFADSKPKTLSREHIDRYKRGDTHPVSALYQLSQVMQFQLDMKETITTGKWYPSRFDVVYCPVNLCIQHLFPLYPSSRNNGVSLCVLCCDWWSPV